MRSALLVAFVALFSISALIQAENESSLSKKLGFQIDTTAPQKKGLAIGKIGTKPTVRMSLSLKPGGPLSEFFIQRGGKAQSQAEAEKACQAAAPTGSWHLPNQMEFRLVMTSGFQSEQVAFWVALDKVKETGELEEVLVVPNHVSNTLDIQTYPQLLENLEAAAQKVQDEGLLGVAYDQLVKKRMELLDLQDMIAQNLENQGYTPDSEAYSAAKAQMEENYHEEISAIKNAMTALAGAAESEIKKLQPTLDQRKAAMAAIYQDTKSGIEVICVAGKIPTIDKSVIGVVPK